MLGRATPLWILGFLGMIGGLLSAIVVLQFAEVIPWAGRGATFIGGPWTGVVAYALVSGMLLVAGYSWIMVKPWASMITILAALVGFFVPFISYIDNTDPRSSAIGPLVVSVLMLIMALRPSTNRAMGQALAGQGSDGGAKKPPPAKPMSAARKRELAEEQKRAAQQQGTAAPALATASASSAASIASTANQAISALPKVAETAPVRPGIANAARSAASALGMPSRRPAKAVAKAPASPKPTPTAPQTSDRPRGFRADEV